MRPTVAHSDDPDASGAVDDLVAQAEAGLDGRAPQGAIVYAAVDIDHDVLLKGLRSRWPGVPLIGCTTDGECSRRHRFCEDSTVLVLLCGDGLEVRVGRGSGLSAGVGAATAAALAPLRGGAPPPLVIGLSESLGVSGAAVVAALQAGLAPGSTLVGGTAGDQWRFRGTRQFFGGDVLSDTVVVLSVHGPLAVSVGVESGWRPIGRRLRVTRADGHLLHELDGRPAMEVFRATFGDHLAPSPEHPFAVYEDEGPAHYLRAPLPTVVEGGSLVLVGDVPVGAELRMTEAGRDQILDGARASVAAARARYPGSDPEGLLVFSCAARKQVLGTRTGQEVDLLAEAAGVDVAGFYTYGEFGPLGPGGPARFHNETVVTALVGR